MQMDLPSYSGDSVAKTNFFSGHAQGSIPDASREGKNCPRTRPEINVRVMVMIRGRPKLL
jgi:hypothetical protein